MHLSLSLALGGLRGGGGSGALSVSSTSVPAEAPAQTMVGRVSGGTQPYTLDDDAGGRFVLIGNDLRASGTALGAGPHNVTINGTVIAITVTPAVALAAVSLNGTTDYYQDAAVIDFSGNNWGAFIFRSASGQSTGGTGEQFIWSNGTTTATSAVSLSVTQDANALGGKLKIRLRDATHATQTNTTGSTVVFNSGLDYCVIFQRVTANVVLYAIPLATLTEVTEATITTGLANLVDFTSAAAGRSGARGGAAASFLRGNVRLAAFGTGVLTAAQRQLIAKGYHPVTDLNLSCRMVHVYTDATQTTIADGSGNGNTAAKVGSGQTTTTLSINAPLPNVVVLTARGEKSVSQRYFPGEGDTTKGPVTSTGFAYGAANALECRILDFDDNSIIKDWTVVNATPTNGANTPTLPSVPAGSWYRIEWRQGIAVSRDTTRHGVGDVHLLIGQSNMARLTEQNSFSVTASGDIGFVGDQNQNWGDISAYPTNQGTNQPAAPGDGGATLGNIMVTETGYPQAVEKAAVGGTSMVNWTRPSGSNYNNAIACVLRNSLDGRVGFVHWNQGEADTGAGAPTDYAARLTFMGNLIDWLKLDLVTPDTDYTWFIVRSLSKTLGSADVGAWVGIKRADYQITLDRAEAAFAGEWLDAVSDGSDLHFADYRIMTRRQVAACLNTLGLGGIQSPVGPVMTSIVEINTTTTDVVFSLPTGATTLTAAASYVKGFRVTQDDFAGTLAISNAVINTATTVRITHAAQTAGTRKVDYCYGFAPDVSNLLRDDYDDGLGNVSGRLAMSQQVGIAA